MEHWESVKDYPLYKVNSHGDVMSLHRGEKKLKIRDNGNGYKIVTLSKNGVRKNKYIHRLVAECFVPRVEGKNVVNHKDFNTSNNAADNLEWVTQRENVHYSSSHMYKRHRSTTNTGERYITKRKNTYRVIWREDGKQKERGFKSLESAVAFRDEVFIEINFAG